MNKSRVPSLLPTLLLILFVLSGLTSRAQLVTNTAILQKASQERSAEDAALQQVLVRTALEKGWPLTLRNKKGRLAYLRGINGQGLPYYITTFDNIISAATIRTNQLWPGGNTNLALNGSSANMKSKIAIWDEGLVRPTHVELVGRVTQVDKSPTLSDHSTHVSGTLIAAGINPVAKGMSFGAQQLLCYDFNNDEAEMMAAAKSGQLLVSNHSYGDIAGWFLDASQNDRWEFWGNPGDTVDIRFGLYNKDTQIWDSIAYNAPLYLIAKAAGNNPGEQGPLVGQTYWRMNTNGTFVNSGPRPAGISNNGGFTTIATSTNAKDILTVGAVNPIPGGYNSPADVVLADFSSMGPTGDGRIKPDVVSDGVNVLSSISTADNAYDIFSGTSMATPAAAGSSFLLQEYYTKLHGATNFMRAATLKGLLIHTADEAGASPGPDYSYGWGLIDMARAASVITSDNSDQSQQIHESSLTNGSKDSETFAITASGKTPVTATICWTDPPGVPVNIPSGEHNFQDISIKLINDLDLRIRDNTTGIVYLPWVLNPTNPAAAATKGDNIRDNVEKVELNDSLVPGRSYTITVSHKSILHRGTQAYTLLISGAGGTAVCSSASSAGGASIDNVVLSNLSNATPPSACRNYTDFSVLTAANLPVGQNVPIAIASTSCNSTNNTRIISVFIDFNNDGVFESNELAAQSIQLGVPFSGTIAVPTTAVVGTYARMRIIVQEGNNAALVSPCGSYGAGETQDYRVLFTNPATDVGVVSLEYPTQSICASDSQIVAVRIHNYGTIAQTSGVPVSTVITTGGTTVATLSAICKDSIPAGGEVVYTYNTSIPTAAGTSYTIVTRTALSGDVNTSNDQNTTIVTINAAEQAGTGTATLCGENATTVSLKATTKGNDVPIWYDSPTSTTPIAAGSNTTTTDIAKTYYLGLNDLSAKGGAPNKLAFAPATGSQGFYYPMGGQFVSISTSVPLTIESARLYVGHAGRDTFTLAQLISLSPTQGYYYIPLSSVAIDVYATKPVPQSGRVSVNAGDNTDTGGIFYLNIPIPTPGDYILIAQCSDSTNLFLNSGITTNHYPVSIPGVFAVTGNSNKYNPNNAADSITYFQQYYFALYDIGIRLNACAAPRTTVTPTTEAAPQISLAGNVFTSSAPSGNQWYLNDSLLVGSTGVTDTAIFPGVYYTIVTDPISGCLLTSNKLTYTPPSGGGNAAIGLRVSNPAVGTLQLQFFMTTADNTSVQLINTLGQKVYEAQYPGFSGIYNSPIDVSYLASGMYVLKIVHGGSTYVEKLIVKKP